MEDRSALSTLLRSEKLAGFFRQFFASATGSGEVLLAVTAALRGIHFVVPAFRVLGC